MSGTGLQSAENADEPRLPLAEDSNKETGAADATPLADGAQPAPDAPSDGKPPADTAPPAAEADAGKEKKGQGKGRSIPEHVYTERFGEMSRKRAEAEARAARAEQEAALYKAMVDGKQQPRNRVPAHQRQTNSIVSYRPKRPASLVKPTRRNRRKPSSKPAARNFRTSTTNAP